LVLPLVSIDVILYILAYKREKLLVVGVSVLTGGFVVLSSLFFLHEAAEKNAIARQGSSILFI
jgi:hypothetical protein